MQQARYKAKMESFPRCSLWILPASCCI